MAKVLTLATAFALLALFLAATSEEGCPNDPSASGDLEGLEEGCPNATSEELAHEEGEEEVDICGEEEEREFDSSVQIARVEFHRVETIFIILAFIMVVVLAKMRE